MNPTASDTASYGMSYVKIDVGLYIHYVEYGSGAYLAGLEAGDLIIAATPFGGSKIDMRTATDAELNQAFAGGWNTSCTVDVIRNLYTVSLGDTVSISQLTMKKVEYGGQFMEYYFGRDNTNLPNEMIAALGLDSLDTDTTGYIRINSFENASYYDGNRYVETDAASEFGAAMNKFRTAYDGKGNAGARPCGHPAETSSTPKKSPVICAMTGKIPPTTPICSSRRLRVARERLQPTPLSPFTPIISTSVRLSRR